MKRITFTNNISQRMYDNYLMRAEQILSILAAKDRSEALMEINSHIYENLQNQGENDEAEHLMDILEKLGEPEVYLNSLAAEMKIKEATRSFNPRAVYHALKLNLKNGLIFNLFAIGYLFLSTFLFLIGAKLIAPNHTGLFYRDGVMDSFGLRSDTAGLEEVLGFWFIPIVAATASLFYLLITILLRLTRRK